MPSSLKSSLARQVIQTYPRAWRQRYADEVAAIVDQGVTYRDVVDLVAGALDAWICEFATGAARHARKSRTIVAYVALQLVVFAVLRVLAGPGRFDLAFVWAVEYSAGFIALSYVLARRDRPTT